MDHRYGRHSFGIGVGRKGEHLGSGDDLLADFSPHVEQTIEVNSNSCRYPSGEQVQKTFQPISESLCFGHCDYDAEQGLLDLIPVFLKEV